MTEQEIRAEIARRLKELIDIEWCEMRCKKILDYYNAEILQENWNSGELEPVTITYAIYHTDAVRSIAIDAICEATELDRTTNGYWLELYGED